MNPLILHADHIVLMNDDNDVLTDGAVLVGGNGRIEAIGEAAKVIAENPHVSVKRLSNRLLMPGLINVHMHSGLLRGTAEGLPLWDWLQQFIDPMHRVLNPAEAETASYLCYAESLLAGTTTVVDMWRYMSGSAKAAEQLGIRAVMVPYVGEHPDHNYFDSLDDNEKMITDWNGGADGRITVWVGLEHMLYAVPEAWKRAVDMSLRYKVGLHTHSNESKYEVDESQRRFGTRPIEALKKVGLMDAYRMHLAHCIWLSDQEIELLASHNVGVAHNPISNMKLASGAARVEDMLAAGINVGLGTDGEKENNNLDVFEEMKTASLLAKLTKLDAAALDSWSVCRMGTIYGARAMGMGDSIGSIEVGKQADLIAIRTDIPHMTPLLGGRDGNLHHNLVHAVQGGDVDMTMVAGRIVVDAGRLLTAELGELVNRANSAVPELFRRRKAWLVEHQVVSEVKRD